MPTKRFAKLGPYKQEAIRHAVMEEFQRTPYGEMQISNIARAAQISRGSLYTYFYNRQDMFLYALDQSWRENLKKQCSLEKMKKEYLGGNGNEQR